MKQEMEETLYSHLRTTESPINLICIGGDLFDSKQYLSSDVTNHVLNFIHDLLVLTKDMQTQIYIVKGTRTHDDLQLQTLKTIMAMNRYHKRVHIIEEVTEVTLVNMGYSDPYMQQFTNWYPLDSLSGYELDEMDDVIKMLFIPEEYIVDQKEYYKDTLYNDNKYYDIIVGHGMVDKIWYANQQTQHGSLVMKHSASPVFAVDDLLKSAGYVYFGHIHTHKKYGDGGRFQYVGPFTRWEFGNDDSVGYLEIEYDFIDHKLFDEIYHVNTKAQRLSTKAITIRESMDLTSLNDLLNITVSQEMEHCDRLRLIVNLYANIENVLQMRGFIISKIGDMPFVKMVLTMIDQENVGLDGNNTVDIEEKRKETLNYFMDRELDKQVHRYIKDKKQIDIPLEDIRRILSIKEE